MHVRLGLARRARVSVGAGVGVGLAVHEHWRGHEADALRVNTRRGRPARRAVLRR